jgi:hypothetical protein
MARIDGAGLQQPSVYFTQAIWDAAGTRAKHREELVDEREAQQAPARAARGHLAVSRLLAHRQRERTSKVESYRLLKGRNHPPTRRGLDVDCLSTSRLERKAHSRVVAFHDNQIKI